METYFWWVNKKGFNYWGDINQKIDLTSQEDVAKFVIWGVLDKNRTGYVKISGNELSTKEIVDIYNMVLGKKEEAKNMGSIQDLWKLIKEKKEAGEWFEWIQLGYALAMYDGSGKIKNKMNMEWPQVKVTTLEDFLKKTQGKPLYESPIPDVVKWCEKQIQSRA